MPNNRLMQKKLKFYVKTPKMQIHNLFRFIIHIVLLLSIGYKQFFLPSQ